MAPGDTSILKGNGSSVIRNDQNGLDASAVLDGFKITGGGGLYVAGGGIYNHQSSPIFANVIICGNKAAEIAGGGMYNLSASPILKNVIISGNSAVDGAGMFNTSSSPIFKNVLICGNTATQSGGGMALYDSPLTLTNVTISGNFSAYGGGIFDNNSSILFNNSILWGNNSGDFSNELYIDLTPSPSIITLNYSLFRNRGGGTDIYGLSGNTLAPDAFSLSVSPQFVDSAGGDYRLSASSPAIDAGTPSTDTAGLNLPMIDLAGNRRIMGSAIDIGTYEFRSIHPDVAGILYVDGAVAVPGDGSSWQQAMPSFGDALMVADTINTAATDSVSQVWVAKGTYQPASGQSFAMLPKVKIYGSFSGNEASLAERAMAAGDTSILLGNGNTVIRNDDNGLDASAVLDGFKITGGGGVHVDGGGIYNGRVSPTFSHLMISGNSSNRGGGMFNGQSSPILTNVFIKGNKADNDYGGGMYNFSSSPILANVIISGNSAYGGGGMEYRQSQIDLTNVVISGNTVASQGGGMDNVLTTGTLTNVTISGNSASSGGGINNLGSSLIFNNSIIWGNNGNDNGNEIYHFAFTSIPASINLNYSLYRNREGEIDIVNDGGTILTDHVYTVSPEFVDSAGGDYRLSAGSPAIDAGNTSLLAVDDTFDLSGNPRIVNSTVDLGAYEFQSIAVPVTIQRFTGSIQNSTATLEWKSGVESNFKGYQLEKSIDGNHFTKLAIVAAKGSNSDYHYSTPQTATKAWYRLQLISQTGESTYYDQIVALQNGAIATSILVYPNPATDYIHIRIAEGANMSLYDAAGKLVRQQNLHAGINQIDIRSLPAGIYYGVVNGQKVKFVKK
ncbi:MAG TPA: T9SS type A sorting domain-containing protein, partial [Arachidicoccus sp.]|nr:T9SS type A sorting domain-containing protein [Arachidicoccus sp.]